MTAPETPPPDVHAAALALAVHMTGLDLDGAPVWHVAKAPGEHTRKRLQLFEAFATAIVDEASRRATLSAVDAWAKEQRRADAAKAAGWCDACNTGEHGLCSDSMCPCPCPEPASVRRRDIPPDQQSQPAPPAQQEIERLQDELDRVRFLSQEIEREYHPMNAADVSTLIERLRARVAELEEHIRRQHALDGERLRDLVQITEGATAWRATSEAHRSYVFYWLGKADDLEPVRAALAALRALAPDPDAARRREELDDARHANEWPVERR